MFHVTDGFGKRKSQRTRGRPFSLSKQKRRGGTGGDKRIRVRVFAQLWPHELFISPPAAAMAVNTAVNKMKKRFEFQNGKSKQERNIYKSNR